MKSSFCIDLQRFMLIPTKFPLSLSILIRLLFWHKKSVENLPVVHSTAWGSRIAYYSRTDNVRAHADMIILPVRSVYTTTHCTYKGTMMAYREPHRNDIITPGTSTVAKFKTIMTLNLRDSKLSQTERQVNALIMSCLYPPFLLCLKYKYP